MIGGLNEHLGESILNKEEKRSKKMKINKTDLFFEHTNQLAKITQKKKHHYLVQVDGLTSYGCILGTNSMKSGVHHCKITNLTTTTQTIVGIHKKETFKPNTTNGCKKIFFF